MHLNSRITIIGAGHVGSHGAMALGQSGLCREIVLVDTDMEKAAAQTEDIADALSGVSCSIRHGTIADAAEADIVVIAVGRPRTPGQTRLDLLGDSVHMMDDLLAQLKRVNLTGIVIVITNPVDIMADYIRRGLCHDRGRVFGTGTLLDTARLKRIISYESGVSRASIDALVMGEHGDSSMIPFSLIKIAGLSFERWQSLNERDILQATRMSGMNIIEGKDFTEFGIAHALAELCTAILTDQKRVFPLSVLLEGEYGQRGIHCGVPCLVGSGGIEEIISLPLTDQEMEQLDASCGVIRRHTEMAQNIKPL